MRLSNFQREAIQKVFKDVFENGKIYLFGSRVDERLKGGDIDLYLDVKDKENLAKKRILFLVKLKRLIGEQKIDIVFNKDKNRPIEREAIENGILI